MVFSQIGTSFAAKRQSDVAIGAAWYVAWFIPARRLSVGADREGLL
jgi:hypothetical protein